MQIDTEAAQAAKQIRQTVDELNRLITQAVLLHGLKVDVSTMDISAIGSSYHPLVTVRLWKEEVL